MSRLYPDLFASVEDQVCHNIIVKQNELFSPNPSAPLGNTSPQPQNALQPASSNSLYPVISSFMGVDLEQSDTAIAYQPVTVGYNQIAAPLSGQSLAFHKTQVTNSVRQLTLCKDKEGKIGLRVKAIDNGIFVCLVTKDSPAAVAGLRFGEQILQINGEDMAGKTMEKVHDMFKKCPTNGINILVRDRPFERSISLHKDSTGHVGFQFKNGTITNIVQGSSAAKNGLLINHQIVEVNGVCVVGMKDKEITSLFDKSDNCIVLTIVPQQIYKIMVEKMATSLFKMMDHSSTI